MPRHRRICSRGSQQSATCPAAPSQRRRERLRAGRVGAGGPADRPWVCLSSRSRPPRQRLHPLQTISLPQLFALPCYQTKLCSVPRVGVPRILPLLTPPSLPLAQSMHCMRWIRVVHNEVKSVSAVTTMITPRQSGCVASVN